MKSERIKPLPKKFLSGEERAFRKKLSRICIAVAAIILLTTVAFFAPFRSLLPATKLPKLRAGELRIHFLDVGQADCSIVQFPDGEVLLIDGGDGAWRQENKLVRYLKGLTPKSISLVATHADFDHFGGFADLFDIFSVQTLYLPVLDGETKAYARLLAKADKEKCAVERLSRYSSFRHPSGAYLVCVSPYEMGETDENQSSCALYFSYEGVNAFFGGDITQERERKLMREYQLEESIFDCGDLRVSFPETDILKVSHHGSKNSSCKEWISLLSPKDCVISCGRGNAYSHPAEQAITNLSAAELYRTDELGDIVASIYQGEYRLYTNFSQTTLEE